MNLIDHRHLTRVDCFHIKLHQGFEPEWNFSPANDCLQPEAILVDFSEHGCCLILGKAVPLDQPLKLEIGLNQERIELVVESRWQDFGYSVSFKRAGLQFVNPPENVSRQMQAIRQAANDQNSGFLTGRVVTQ